MLNGTTTSEVDTIGAADEVLSIFTEMGLGVPGMRHRIEELRADVGRLARQWIPRLGTDALFEVL